MTSNSLVGSTPRESNELRQAPESPVVIPVSSTSQPAVLLTAYQADSYRAQEELPQQPVPVDPSQPIPEDTNPLSLDGSEPDVLLVPTVQETTPREARQSNDSGNDDDPQDVNTELAENDQEKTVDDQETEERNRIIEARDLVLSDSLPPGVVLDEVIASIHSSFPLLEAAYQENRIAAGKQLAAWGNFDTKLSGSSENQPLGFYETYRQRAGIYQPLYDGGQVFGGYRIGRNDFEPWYKERETNAGGEFKTGIRVPLARNRDIDARRAALWRATYDVQRAQPDIQKQLIQFVRDGSIVYWEWIAAGLRLEIAERALELANERNEQLRRRVEEGDLDPPVLKDNQRSIATRQAKVVDLERKLRQTAFKLSLFYRSVEGIPLVLEDDQTGGFPEFVPVEESQLEASISQALANRPEFASLDAKIRRVRVDLAEARNDMLPLVDAQLTGSQDMGAPASSLRDKSQFELEAGLYLELPVQRRKGRGKAVVANGKLVQLSAERRFVVDKVRAEVQAALTALVAAQRRLENARESRELASYMAKVEYRKFELGESDLFAVALREQSAIEAAEGEVDALFDLFVAQADLNAAMAFDWPGR